ncbi:MAG: nucleotidyltransferase family protein [Gammaproteobacteria bacterium]|jgi:N-acetyl-alpha-D-muramate 1-phosphate uridylyltransferase|nr:nucleotidyltransferase family protein [Gammaproteobacteria bacterium]MBT5205335.1 nucleotidyltransferase family protein [Gammaproteobacteria bacterium]MBT5601516.1 nucleotidyltransferase family protein [Gammaproteobacteria bacterium]MBT6244067.1 nucleotidyltransferase family protein [Gammaproteobacteria bacterium]
MNALLLSAGEGLRMRPLTDKLPKPLLQMAGQTLIERHLYNLRDSGFKRVVINLHYLGEKLLSALGNGDRYGLDIQYSHEPSLLDTGGGAKAALALLGDQPFAMISSDVYSDFSFRLLRNLNLDKSLGHLILVPNPAHHPTGDFSLIDDLVGNDGERHTFSGISVLHPQLLSISDSRVFPIRDVLRPAAAEGRLSGQLYKGAWSDVGTPSRLKVLEESLLKANEVRRK